MAVLLHEVHAQVLAEHQAWATHPNGFESPRGGPSTQRGATDGEYLPHIENGNEFFALHVNHPSSYRGFPHKRKVDDGCQEILLFYAGVLK